MTRRQPRARTFAAASAVAGLLWVCCIAATCSDVNLGVDGDRAYVVPADSVHVIGTSERITSIRDVMPGPDGAIWALNSTDPFFVAFDQDGSVITAFGDAGQGPHEFRLPDVYVREPNDGGLRVYDRDPGRNALIRVAPAEPWTELEVSRDSAPAPRILYPHLNGASISNVWLRPGDGIYYAARARPDFADELRWWNSDVIAIDADDGSVRTLLRLPELIGSPETKFPNGRVFMPHPLWEVCPSDGTILIYDPLANSVRRFDSEGSEMDSFELPPERSVPTTEDRVYAMVSRFAYDRVGKGSMPDTAEMRMEFNREWNMISFMFGPVFPEYNDLRCTERGQVWIAPFDHESVRYGLGPHWLVLHEDDSYDAVTLPAGFVSLRFVGDRIWGYVRDDYGVQYVAWIAVPRLAAAS